MAAGAFFGHGSTVEFNSLDVAGPLEIVVPGAEKEDVETTSHDSGGTRTYVAGLRDPATFSITFRVVPDDAGQAELIDNWQADGNTVEEMVITAVNGADPVKIYTFDAYVRNVSATIPHEGDTANMEVEFRATSVPVITDPPV